MPRPRQSVQVVSSIAHRCASVQQIQKTRDVQGGAHGCDAWVVVHPQALITQSAWHEDRPLLASCELGHNGMYSMHAYDHLHVISDSGGNSAQGETEMNVWLAANVVEGAAYEEPLL
jgi:hypothetical protein